MEKTHPQEVREFGETIGISIDKINNHPSNKKYSASANLLHEIGHWAVYPELITKNQKGNIPGFTPPYFNLWKHLKEMKYKLPEIHEPGMCPYCFFALLDVFPDEWGVQEWARQVAYKHGWIDCDRYWMTDSPKEWEYKRLFGDVSKKGQLSRVGIDVQNGVYRPPITAITTRGDGLTREVHYLKGSQTVLKHPLVPYRELIGPVPQLHNAVAPILQQPPHLGVIDFLGCAKGD
ncbi:MAG: hypothetical protein F6K55_03130 [Moorea sp. SIO4A3]|nr:hypothetical protein [Moorena sp. SIO4A3]